MWRRIEDAWSRFKSWDRWAELGMLAALALIISGAVWTVILAWRPLIFLVVGLLIALGIWMEE